MYLVAGMGIVHKRQNSIARLANGRKIRVNFWLAAVAQFVFTIEPGDKREAWSILLWIDGLLLNLALHLKSSLDPQLE